MKTRHPLGLHIQVLLSNPELLYNLITLPFRIAFHFVQLKILEARRDLRNWMKAIRKK